MEEGKFIDKECMMECIDLLFTSFWKILSYLKANKDLNEPIYSRHIQKAFHITKGTVSYYLVRLEKLGLIRRNRAIPHAISITESGECFVPK